MPDNCIFVGSSSFILTGLLVAVSYYLWKEVPDKGFSFGGLAFLSSVFAGVSLGVFVWNYRRWLQGLPILDTTQIAGYKVLATTEP